MMSEKTFWISPTTPAGRTAWIFSCAVILIAICLRNFLFAAGTYVGSERFYWLSVVLIAVSQVLGHRTLLVPAAVSLYLAPLITTNVMPHDKLRAMSSFLHASICIGYVLRFSSEDREEVRERASVPIWWFGAASLLLAPCHSMVGISSGRIFLFVAACPLLLLLPHVRLLPARLLAMACLVIYATGKVIPFWVTPYAIFQVACAMLLAQCVDSSRFRMSASLSARYSRIGFGLALGQLITQNFSWLAACLCSDGSLQYCEIVAGR